jgi:hypothetical protein
MSGLVAGVFTLGPGETRRKEKAAPTGGVEGVARKGDVRRKGRRIVAVVRVILLLVRVAHTGIEIQRLGDVPVSVRKARVVGLLDRVIAQELEV